MAAKTLVEVVGAIPTETFGIIVALSGGGGLGMIVFISRLIVKDILRKEVDDLKVEIGKFKEKLAATEHIFASFHGVVESLHTLNVQVAEIRKEMMIRSEQYSKRHDAGA